MQTSLRTIRCDLALAKTTEQKLRWDTGIHGVKFEIYIPKWRVPQPTPTTISVEVLDADQQTGLDQEVPLPSAGLTADQIRDLTAGPGASQGDGVNLGTPNRCVCRA